MQPEICVYHGITQAEGFVGLTAEDTIRNLSLIGARGISQADDTILEIMMDKADERGVRGKPAGSDHGKHA